MDEYNLEEQTKRKLHNLSIYKSTYGKKTYSRNNYIPVFKLPDHAKQHLYILNTTKCQIHILHH